MQTAPDRALAGLQDEYARYTLANNIRNSKIACLLVIIFMPVGAVLDYWVYPDQLAYFLKLRLLCSAITVFVLWRLLKSGLSTWEYRMLCMAWYFLPALFIAWMIAETEGAASPYYAGLNLVILLASSVIQATLVETLVVVSLIISMYLSACLVHSDFGDGKIFFNNCYFIALTGIIVCTGNYFFNRLRFREFALRHELEENRLQLEQSNRKLVELDQIKNRFFANISHELRTPLTLLLAPLESLIREKINALDAQAREWTQTMQANGMRLLRLINDLLDLVRLESGKVEIKLEPVAVVDFVRGLAQSVQQLAQNRKLTLRIDVSDSVGVILTDRDKLEKMLLNLLFNAIKFTPPGGRIEVNAARDGNWLLLNVSDNGIGISEKHLPHIFDRFWQADSSPRRKHRGTGIGLALVKELAQVQGGKVDAKSAEGKGTTVTVRLPYRQTDLPQRPPEPVVRVGADSLPTPEPPAASAFGNNEWLANLYRRAEWFPATQITRETTGRPEPVRTGPERPVVLVADDEPDMLRFLSSQLSSTFQVVEATDGQQAVDLAGQYLPDLVLCDMMMPEKDGFQVCRELRERTSTETIPFILLTARADEETKIAALSAGASDFLTKPFSGTELHVRITNLIGSYQLQKRLARQNQVLEATVDQLKETELQLVQSEKLASLGRMSAGIIHEINNPINYAKTALFMLRKKGERLGESDRGEFDEIIRDIEDGIQRVRTIVSDLRGFTHPQVGQFDQVPLGHTIELALRFLSSEWKGKVEIDNQVDPQHVAWANQNRIVQILVNLLQNALDSLKKKVFATGGPAIRIQSRLTPTSVQLLIRDNGDGISPDHLPKIFDPFFSTKDVGQGMGLGLSICYRIMQDHQGRILVQSEPGQYCEFTLEFPLKHPKSTA